MNTSISEAREALARANAEFQNLIWKGDVQSLNAAKERQDRAFKVYQRAHLTALMDRSIEGVVSRFVEGR